MPRYKLTIEYDGTGLLGWQRQVNGMSVQQLLEEAIQKFCGETVVVKGAGRTDSGVHATGQVAHIDLEGAREPRVVMNAVNYHLKPAAVAITAVEEVDGEFDARFSATGRQYLYRILNRTAPPTLTRNHVWHVIQPLDMDAMNEAAGVLIGRHDFTTFRATQCQAKSPVKTLDRLEFHRVGEEIHATVAARSFLHNQVRAMVGTLSLVGLGRWTKEDVAAALESRDRQAGGPNAPAHGLYLTHVRY